MDIAKRIRIIREAKGITQEELANRAQVSQAFISSVENKTKNVSLKVLEKICKKGLEISLASFFNKNIEELDKNIEELDKNKETTGIDEIVESLRNQLQLLVNKKEKVDEEIIIKSKELDKALENYYNTHYKT
ncbi:helix-turn-helix domain-containing protein [Fuchsiella alkaliacetigena]|uniref:helix-turn-helix domain-containing protein n=1 Tax=Fuchsiella alkaliacetigena TaxID=957042 RepID=UPI002009E6CF|nr:helix-turn-helix transcriptional regulator [Fuchsiella alkaliacetigena]MCK8824868.1 XRE family transcriptional regulator [Fuchsiella alkaliacetigena]